MPLADVLRIEQLPLSRIEYIGRRPVLNFEGQLMPVEDSGGVISAAQGNAAADHEAQIIVVVCRQGNRHLGIAVSHVLDVAAGDDLFEAGTRQRTGGVTLLKNRVTGVVGLGAVASLPTAENATEDWNRSRRHRHELQQHFTKERIGFGACGGLLGALGRDLVRCAHCPHP